MSGQIATKTVNLGRLPVYVGDYGENLDPAVGYHKYNIVTYLGSTFINMVEGNFKLPVIAEFDEQGRIVSYSFNDEDDVWTGWKFITNALDSSIASTHVVDDASSYVHDASVFLNGFVDHINLIDSSIYNIFEALALRPVHQKSTEDEIDEMIANHTWVEDVIYYTVEE